MLNVGHRQSQSGSVSMCVTARTNSNRLHWCRCTSHHVSRLKWQLCQQQSNFLVLTHHLATRWNCLTMPTRLLCFSNDWTNSAPTTQSIGTKTEREKQVCNFGIWTEMQQLRPFIYNVCTTLENCHSILPCFLRILPRQKTALLSLCPSLHRCDISPFHLYNMC